jgi:hypothetical protein
MHTDKKIAHEGTQRRESFNYFPYVLLRGQLFLRIFS